MKDKSSLRTHFFELLKRQDSYLREKKSFQILEKLIDLGHFKKANTILFYASLPSEVDTFAMIVKAIELKKRILLPVIKPDDKTMIPIQIKTVKNLQQGSLNIPQPIDEPSTRVSIHDIDAVIVPGLAFDKSNHRLGRGAGYYDRFLSTLPKTTVTIGLAFDFQLTDRLPVEPHDVALTTIIAN